MPATPGTSTKVVIAPAIGLASSETYDPFFPIEAGREYVTATVRGGASTDTIKGK